MNDRVWHAVDVVVDPEMVEAVESAFNELDSLGTEVDWLRKQPQEPRCVTGFFDHAPDPASVRTAVEAMLGGYGAAAGSLLSISTRQIGEIDWLAEWKKHWQPTEVGRFIVTPPWIAIDDSHKIVIRIEPKMAFGTGTHETTQLCLEAIGELFTPEQSFLDVGTGTGVLAIAAAKLGGRSICGYDTDADSVVLARENAELNGVGELIDLVYGPVTAETATYDVVCANVTLDVIVPILDLLLMRSCRTLVLSGILSTQWPEITREIAARGGTPVIKEKGEWIAVVIDRAF